MIVYFTGWADPAEDEEGIAISLGTLPVLVEDSPVGRTATHIQDPGNRIDEPGNPAGLGPASSEIPETDWLSILSFGKVAHRWHASLRWI